MKFLGDTSFKKNFILALGTALGTGIATEAIKLIFKRFNKDENKCEKCSKEKKDG